jgi:hypothetical protein
MMTIGASRCRFPDTEPMALSTPFTRCKVFPVSLAR